MVADVDHFGGLSANNIHAIAEDHQGDLWIGTELGQGFGPAAPGPFYQLPQRRFPSANILSLHVDAQDVLWIGTMGNGLIRFRDGKATHYWTQNGLIANSIDYMIEDDEGCLWIGCNAEPDAGKQKRPQHQRCHAIASVFCRGPATSATGCLRLNALSARSPRRADRPTARSGFQPTPAWSMPIRRHPFQHHPAAAVIEQVLAEEKEQNTNGLNATPPSTVTLPAGTEQLEIHYTSLKPLTSQRTAPDSVTNFPARTATPTSGKKPRPCFARYETLQPGFYLFQVQACNEDGVWNRTGLPPGRHHHALFLADRLLPRPGRCRPARPAAAAVYFISTQKLHCQVAAISASNKRWKGTRPHRATFTTKSAPA